MRSFAVLMLCGFCSFSAVAVIDPQAVETLQARFNDDGAQESRAEELEDQARVAETLRGIKRMVAEQVVSGKMSLADATLAFRHLHHTDPDHLEHLQEVYPLACEHELVAREVLAEVELLLQGQPEKANAVRHRLDEELRGTSI